jgi:hypothetical protein
MSENFKYVWLGFLSGYLLTRLFLSGAFLRAEIDQGVRAAVQDLSPRTAKVHETTLLLRFNRRLRASVRGLPFKCKSDTIHNGLEFTLPGEISQFTHDCGSPS